MSFGRFWVISLSMLLRAFVLFDGSVSTEGIENNSLIPAGKPAVNYFIAVLFYLGIFSGIKSRSDKFFTLTYLLNIISIQLPTFLIPGWGRGIAALPCLYYFAAKGIDFLSKARIPPSFYWFSVLFLTVLSLFFGFFDLKTYWLWVKSKEFIAAQEPAISITDYPLWQKFQREWVKEQGFPFSSYEWKDDGFRIDLTNKTGFFLKSLL
jgi:hypothetical protein